MTKRPKLRTSENANRICELLAEGHTLRQVAREIGLQTESGIVAWGNDEGDPAFRERYARAMVRRWERMADELLEISDADCTVDGKPDNALVQKQRLQTDNRKWLLARMLPRQFGDRVTQEIVGEDGSQFVSRIELVPIDPRPRLTEADAETASAGEAAATPLRALSR